MEPSCARYVSKMRVAYGSAIGADDGTRPPRADSLCLALSTFGGPPNSARITFARRALQNRVLRHFNCPQIPRLVVVFFERLLPFEIAEANVWQARFRRSGERTPTPRLSDESHVANGTPSLTWLRHLTHIPMTGGSEPWSDAASAAHGLTAAEPHVRLPEYY